MKQCVTHILYIIISPKHENPAAFCLFVNFWRIATHCVREQ